MNHLIFVFFPCCAFVFPLLRCYMENAHLTAYILAAVCALLVLQCKWQHKYLLFVFDSDSIQVASWKFSMQSHTHTHRIQCNSHKHNKRKMNSVKVDGVSVCVSQLKWMMVMFCDVCNLLLNGFCLLSLCLMLIARNVYVNTRCLTHNCLGTRLFDLNNSLKLNNKNIEMLRDAFRKEH